LSEARLTVWLLDEARLGAEPGGGA